MEQSAVSVAPRAASVNVAGAVGVVLLLVALAVLLVWPLIALFVQGVAAPPPLAIVLTTMAIAVSSTLGALALAGILAAAVRVGVPGGGVLRGVCRVGLLIPPFVVPIALIALAGAGSPHSGFGDATLGRPVAIVVAQSFAFLPHAFALVMRALNAVSTEAELAAKLLGASRWTVLRRVTLGLAQPRLISATFVVLGLCLADVATPLLFGAGDVMLAVYIVSPADLPAIPAGGALALSVLTLTVALAGRTWHEVTVPFAPAGATPSGMTPTVALRAILTPLAWLTAAAMLLLWATVPLASVIAPWARWHLTLQYWNELRNSTDALAQTLLLALGVALVGTTLALLAASLVARGRRVAVRVTTWLTRVPVAIPGVVAGLGYLMTFGTPGGSLALLVLLVAVWELPLTLSVAAEVLARADQAREQAAVSLGAGRITILRRVVLPTLKPAAAWIFAHGFASGLTAVGTVIAIVAQGRLDLGVADMLRLAVLGQAGPACALATALVALAGAATLLGRAAAGRESIPTLLA